MGGLLKRNAWVDQINWKVYPNLSVLLVGPSGIGKDTAIDAAEDVIHKVGGLTTVSGRTIETIYEMMLGLGDPAACYIPAPEITAFLGSKDYQQSMSQEITDLLSTKLSKNVATKTAMKQGGRVSIPRPTVTMHAGSTEEWLHKAMPEGSMEGGLWPRFLIIYEEYGGRSVPLLKLLPKAEVNQAVTAYDTFIDETKKLVETFTRRPREIDITTEAAELYENWYRNRFRIFSKVVQPYANRSRDQVLRLAMLCAISRKRTYCDAEDMKFGIDMIAYVAQAIDHVMRPPTIEAQVAREVIKLIPATHKEIYKALGHVYDRRYIVGALQYLQAIDQIEHDEPNKRFIRKDDSYERSKTTTLPIESATTD